MAEGQVSTTLSEGLLVALILFSLLFETLLHRLEHYLQHHHRSLVGVLRVLYRELMVLGLVSFIFIVYELTAKPSGNTVLSFEFAHIFIFLLAIFYTFIVLCTMFLSSSLSKKWKRMESMDLVGYLSNRDKYFHMRDMANRRGLFWWFPNVAKLFKYRKLHETMAFHDIRLQFIYFRDLPDNFRFASFLRKVKTTTFVELVESHWSLWVIFLIVILLDIVRRLLLNNDNTESDEMLLRAFASIMRGKEYEKKFSDEETVFDSIFTIVVAVFLSLCVQLLAWKIRYVYWKLMKNPRIYYEEVDTNIMMAELQKLADEDSSSRSQQMETDEQKSRGPIKRELDSRRSESIRAVSLDIRHQTTPISNRTIGTSPLPDVEPVGSNLPHRALQHSIERVSASPGSPKIGQKLEEVGKTSLPIENRRHSLELPSPSISRRQLSAPFTTHKIGSPKYKLVRTAIDAARKTTQEVRDSSVSQKIQNSYESSNIARKTLAGNPLKIISGQSGQIEQESLIATSPQKRSSDVPTRVSSDSKGTGPSRKVSLEIPVAAAINRDELSEFFQDTMKSRNFSTGQDGLTRQANESDTDENLPEVLNKSKEQSLSQRTANINESVRIHVIGSRVEQPSEDNQENANLSEEQLAVGGAGPLKRNKTVINSTILKNYEAHHSARRKPVPAYPRIMVKLIPRLARIASPLEKLFWFGSHRFFFWCVEFVLFFSTVLLSAAAANVSLSTVRGLRINTLEVVSLGISILNLAFVLLRIAVIIKRYIFILHNASLIPEVVALETIQRVKAKAIESGDFVLREGKSSSGTEMDLEDEDDGVGESRSSLNCYLRTQAENGNIL